MPSRGFERNAGGFVCISVCLCVCDLDDASLVGAAKLKSIRVCASECD